MLPLHVAAVSEEHFANFGTAVCSYSRLIDLQLVRMRSLAVSEEHFANFGTAVYTCWNMMLIPAVKRMWHLQDSQV